MKIDLRRRRVLRLMHDGVKGAVACRVLSATGLAAQPATVERQASALGVRAQPAANGGRPLV